MKRVLRFLLFFLGIGVCVILTIFLLLTLYYRSNFPVNTWINGIYCTGKTVEQVNEELVKMEKEPAVEGLSHGREMFLVVILGQNGIPQTIEAAAAGLTPDYTNALKKYLKQSAGSFWTRYLQDAKAISLAAESYTWDEGRLRAAFDALDIVTEEAAKEDGVFLGYDEEAGYFLADGNRGRLDTQKAYDYLKTCLSQGKTVVSLVSGDCYYDREDTLQDREQRELWEKINAFGDCKIVYDMGAESIPLTAAVTSCFLERKEGDGGPALDGNGNLVVSEAKVRSWVEQLAAQYDTCKTEREFLSTRGDVVTVKYGTYGTKIDTEAEVKYLVKAVQEKRTDTEVHIPAYEQKAYARGLDDIGDTYIEVDMTEQRMYFYVDGELVIETDVVTGDVSRRRGTPEGIYYVYSKQRNRILRGTGYASFVKYWMPVVGGVGLHDASWRNKFGGEIYKNDGSHGCINTPEEYISKLYEMAEIGMPVIMFY